jgi:hypothetical protein
MTNTKVFQVLIPGAIDLEILKKDVGGKHPTLPMEKEFIRQITFIHECLQRKKARDYFLRDFSNPILKYVKRYVYGNNRMEEIWGEYYLFISQENKNTHMSYYKLNLYANINNSTLRNYITAITVRYFVNKKAKEDFSNRLRISIDASSDTKKGKKENNVIENPWFNLLIGNNGNEDNWKNDITLYEKINYVLSKLPKRDEKIIKMMVMDDMSGLDAFEDLKDEFERSTRIPISTWTKKQKQDAMALQKSRALKHFNKIVTDENINF